ncbi:MAG TPA: class I SAM-dependent methyltransferase [Candidatus Krumholzibacteria bacterium]|nr:class I SAM-dependent methyltransferase [Candidatus Krumholzibacteria bacterium]
MTVTTDPEFQTVAGSFRDPAGFVFESRGRLFRQINRSFAAEFDAFVASGLCERLMRDGVLISHTERALGDVVSPHPALAHRMIEPERIGFVSYPYEWCFSQLKDAALTTLAIQASAIEHGFSLRDASAFNIQFHRGKPVFIDTLSFEPYREGEPWVAYRQFCQHFLAPLALAARVDTRLALLTRPFIDGVPLDVASRLLPASTRWSPSLSIHIHLHARSQRRFASTAAVKKRRVSRLAMRGLVDSLAGAVKKLQWTPAGTEWGDYYADTNYSSTARDKKAATVGDFIARARPSSVWDLGANTGEFSRLAAEKSIPTVAFDVDAAAVEKNYRMVRERGETHMLPLVMDLTNPSPALGWDHEERASLAGRGPADLVLALALIHHLSISNNVPLDRVARFFARVGRALVIEFVPKTDSQVQRLLATRADVFPDYTRAGFEAAFAPYFEAVEQRPVEDSERILYLMRRRDRP